MPISNYLAPEIVASFLTLTFLEIVLAGDNLVLIAILAGKLPEAQRPLARRVGLVAAMFTRLALLFSLFWLAHLQVPFSVPLPGGLSFAITPREIVLGVGGLFLIWKSLTEISAIFAQRNTKINADKLRPWRHAFALTIVQIAIFDIAFSLDSVIAALGLTQHVEVMATAIITAAFVMFFLVNPISNFIDRHKIVRLVALNFLTLVGALLIAEAADLAVPRLYFYAALGVAIVVQLMALWLLSWSPRTRHAVTLLLVVLGIAAVFGVTLFVNRDSTAGARDYAALVSLARTAADLVTAAFDWVRSLLPAK
jgi:predicted tellurium resistance membrane protein TerC